MIFYKYILTYGSPFTLLIGGIFGMYYLKYLSKSYKLILSYLAISLIIDITSRIMAGMNNNNLILWPILSLIEINIFSLVFIPIIRKKFLWIFTAIASAYIIYEIIIIDSFNASSFQPYAKIISSAIIVLYLLIVLIQRIKNESILSRKEQVFNLTILCYFALNVVLLLPINFLINENPEITIYIWTTYLILTILFYSCLSILLWKNGKNQKRLYFG